MARVALPQSRLKARRRARRLRLVIIVIGFILLAALGAVALSYAPFWRISTIVVMGAESIATSTVQAFVQEELKGSHALIFPKDNILLYPKASLQRDILAEFPAVRSVVLRAQNFSTVEVELLERKPHALWCGNERAGTNSCFLLDDSGVAYESALSFTGSAYTQYYGATVANGALRQYLTEEKFNSLDALVIALAQKVQNDSLLYVAVDSLDDVRVGFGSGFVLIFSSKDDGADIYQRFELTLTSEPFKSRALSDFEYLDLRFGDKLYYKLK
ncbi:hypothetical protein H7X87_02665 [Acetobacteraceae bacterium]|nr:hypothetical protein [Candidatus Parcubacteria bacterium]